MNDVILGEIISICYMVERGKPCACEAVKNSNIEEVIEQVHRMSNLKTYIDKLSQEWKTVWIYKDDYMLEIIKLLPEEPKTNFEHWVLGKAFGYSDEAIKDFLKPKL
ncbi:MAG: hypothetical protein ACREV6_19550 [Clostridium sp.]|uniref:hypothetical protein n=1 Tax=Clostridium sp. TaxID=1506 RepID=UPI003D6CC1D3